MKVKAGDEVIFLALEWVEPQWEFDHPTVVLLPVVAYSPNGEAAEKMIEDICIDLSINADILEGNDEVESEDVSKEFEWRGWNLKRMLMVANKRLGGDSIWSSKNATVVYQKVKFYKEEDETQFEIMETIQK